MLLKERLSDIWGAMHKPKPPRLINVHPSEDVSAIDPYSLHPEEVYKKVCEDIAWLDNNLINEPVVEYREIERWLMKDKHFVQRIKVRDSIWLLADVDHYDFEERLQHIIVSKEEEELTYNDYISLLHASYQDEATRNVLSNLPLSMLRDVYAPLIVESKRKYIK
jgi:hypothetical protein